MFVLPVSRSSRPAAIVTRSPSFSSLVERLFDDSFDRVAHAPRDAHATRMPAMDVSESDTTFTVAFDVPGATRDQLKVSVEGRRVVLATVAPVEAAAADATPSTDAAAAPAAAAVRTIYRERAATPYARTVVLPAEVDQAASQAKFENGVLTLTLAKKVPAGATELAIG